jgi:hypothetical protein
MVAQLAGADGLLVDWLASDLSPPFAVESGVKQPQVHIGKPLA